MSGNCRNDPSFKAVPAAPWGPLRRLRATFDSLSSASGRHLDDIFHCFSEACFGLFLNGLFIRLGNHFRIVFVILSNSMFKLADLCKCARRQHGNLVFEILAHWNLIVFSIFLLFPTLVFA